jgi:membrane-associated phospholipid phosphatase
MRIKTVILVFILLSFAITTKAQNDTITDKPIQKNSLLKKCILPVSLIAGGFLISKSDFEKSFQKSVQSAVGHNFSTTAEDYTRYAPIVELYAADLLGVKAKNHWFDQSKNLAISIIVTDFITFKLKNHIYKIRPNGSSDGQSFPSAHTSSAFTNATVLFEEFKGTSPLLAYSGYAFATTTGALRIMNNAHWLSDVVAGAGIGFLVANVVYYFDPIIKWNPFKKTKDIVLLPEVNNHQYGFYMCVKLK